MRRASTKPSRRRPPSRVVRLTPEHGLARAAKRFLPRAAADGCCTKCGSAFVGREPAFVHCYYCGAMTRIADASLLAQEVFEMRSGLRMAS